MTSALKIALFCEIITTAYHLPANETRKCIILIKSIDTREIGNMKIDDVFDRDINIEESYRVASSMRYSFW